MCLYVIHLEVRPVKLATALATLAFTVRMPDKSALFRRKGSARVLSLKEGPHQAKQYVMPSLSLNPIVSCTLNAAHVPHK
jgi:hypothetical protein